MQGQQFNVLVTEVPASAHELPKTATPVEHADSSDTTAAPDEAEATTLGAAAPNNGVLLELLGLLHSK